MVIAEWQVGQVFWSMLWFTLFFLWVFAVVMVFSDIFRSRDMGGGSKALWSLFVILFPYLGVFVYLLARGNKMSERNAQEAAQADEAMQSYIRTTVATPATDMEALADLRNRGVIDDAEYESMKGRVAPA